MGSPHLYSFHVSARSSEDRYVTAKTQGQIERRALVSPIAGLFLLLLTFGGIGLFRLQARAPVPVNLTSFAVTPASVREGKPVTLTWDVSGDKPIIKLSHARRAARTARKFPTANWTNAPATRSYIPRPAQDHLHHHGERPAAESKTERRSVTVNVNAKPAAPRPSISRVYRR